MIINLDDLTRKLNPHIYTGHLRRCFCNDDGEQPGCLPRKKAVLIAALQQAIAQEKRKK